MTGLLFDSAEEKGNLEPACWARSPLTRVFSPQCFSQKTIQKIRNPTEEAPVMGQMCDMNDVGSSGEAFVPVEECRAPRDQRRQPLTRCRVSYTMA